MIQRLKSPLLVATTVRKMRKMYQRVPSKKPSKGTKSVPQRNTSSRYPWFQPLTVLQSDLQHIDEKQAKAVAQLLHSRPMWRANIEQETRPQGLNQLPVHGKKHGGTTQEKKD